MKGSFLSPTLRLVPTYALFLLVCTFTLPATSLPAHASPYVHDGGDDKNKKKKKGDEDDDKKKEEKDSDSEEKPKARAGTSAADFRTRNPDRHRVEAVLLQRKQNLPDSLKGFQALLGEEEIVESEDAIARVAHSVSDVHLSQNTVSPILARQIDRAGGSWTKWVTGILPGTGIGVKEKQKFVADRGAELLSYNSSFLAHVLLFGKHRKLKLLLKRVLYELRVDGDKDKYEYHQLAVPLFGMHGRGEEIYGWLGAIAMCETTDEFAALIANELTRSNPQYLKRDAVGEPNFQRVLQELHMDNLEPEIKEALRLELGTVDRLARAGFDPYAYFTILERLANWRKGAWDTRFVRNVYKVSARSFAYFTKRLPISMRMAVAKHYVGVMMRKDRRYHERSDIEYGHDPAGSLELAGVFASIRARAYLLSIPFLRPWFQRWVGYGGPLATAGIWFVDWHWLVSLLTTSERSTRYVRKTPAPREPVQQVPETVETLSRGIDFDFVTKPAKEIGSEIGRGLHEDFIAFGESLAPVRMLLTEAGAIAADAATATKDWLQVETAGIPQTFEHVWESIASQAPVAGKYIADTAVHDVADPLVRSLESTVYDGVQPLEELWDTLEGPVQVALESGAAVVAEEGTIAGRHLHDTVYEGIVSFGESLPIEFFENHWGTILTTMGVLAGATLATGIYYGVLSSSPHYEKLVRLKKLNRENARTAEKFLATGKVAPFDWIRLLRTNVTTLNLLEAIYARRNRVRNFAWMDGLALHRQRSRRAFFTLVDQCRQSIAGKPERERQLYFGEMIKILDRLPADLMEQKAFRDKVHETLALDPDFSLQAERQRSWAKKTGEGKARYRLRLLSYHEDVGEMEVAELIDYTHALQKAGLYHTADEMFGRRGKRMFEHATSKEGSRSLITKMIQIIRTKQGRPGVANRLKKRYNELLLFLRQVVTRFRPLEERVALVAVSEKIPLTSWRYLSPRYWINRREKKHIKREMARSFTSVEDFTRFVDTELIPRHIDVNELRRLFFNIVAGNPGWVRAGAAGERDIEALMQKDYLWPHFGASQHDVTDLEALFVGPLKKLAKQFPKIWIYEPGAAERFHLMVINWYRQSGRYPKTLEEKTRLWLRLTTRGVSSTTDGLFTEMYDMATTDEKEKLEAHALDEGRIWEQEIRARIARRKIMDCKEWKNLERTTRPKPRERYYRALIAKAKEYLPERGHSYTALLEEMSAHFESSPAESTLITEAQRDVGQGSSSGSDASVLHQVANAATTWKRADQWELIKYLRGDREYPNAKTRVAFRVIGAERLRRMYQILPQMGRAAIIDIILMGGLLTEVKLGKGYTKTIITHVTKGHNQTLKSLTKDILDGFLYALERVSRDGFKSSLLAYLLSFNGDDHATPAHTLLRFGEFHGSTGLKILQGIIAARILPKKDEDIIRPAQSRAALPTVEERYEHWAQIFGSRDEIPFKAKRTRHAASIKYGTPGRLKRKKGGERVFVKTVREEAFEHTPFEFRLLEQVAERLARIDFGKFGIFKAIVWTSIISVQKELEVAEEPEKSGFAGAHVYRNASDGFVQVEVPREIFLKGGVIIAELAKGVTYNDLPDALKPFAARVILKREARVLFAHMPGPRPRNERNQLQVIIDRAAERKKIHYCPDRHPGNEIFEIVFDGSRIILRSKIIDLGQLTHIEVGDRGRLFETFAIAQVLREAGPTKYLRNRLARALRVGSYDLDQFGRNLNALFPNPDMSRPTAYYAALAAAMLRKSTTGLVPFFEWMRAIIQLKQYEGAAGGKVLTPEDLLTQQVKPRAERALRNLKLNLTWREGLDLLWQRMSWQNTGTLLSSMLGLKPSPEPELEELLPDLEEFEPAPPENWDWFDGKVPKKPEAQIALMDEIVGALEEAEECQAALRRAAALPAPGRSN